MSFDSNKINQMVNDKQRQAQTGEIKLNQGIGILISKCLSRISSEEFENDLQKVLEEIIENDYHPSSFDDDCKIQYCFDYGIYLPTNNTTAILFLLLSVGVGTHCSNGAIINEEVEINNNANIGILNEYNSSNPMQNKIEEVQARFEEKIKDLSMQCWQTKFEEGVKNNAQSQDYLYGTIQIGNNGKKSFTFN